MQRLFKITYDIPCAGGCFTLKTINNSVSEALFEVNQVAAARVEALAAPDIVGALLLYDAFVEKIEIITPDM